MECYSKNAGLGNPRAGQVRDEDGLEQTFSAQPPARNQGRSSPRIDGPSPRHGDLVGVSEKLGAIAEWQP